VDIIPVALRIPVIRTQKRGLSLSSISELQDRSRAAKMPLLLNRPLTRTKHVPGFVITTAFPTLLILPLACARCASL